MSNQQQQTRLPRQRSHKAPSTRDFSPSNARLGDLDRRDFDPILEGRLFTATDAHADASCEVYPAARLSYDALPELYRQVFKNCRVYLSMQTQFVKFLQAASEAEEGHQEISTELLKKISIHLPHATDKKKWQCGVVGCQFKDTLQHLLDHLLTKTHKGKAHIGLKTFPCRYCATPFTHNQDRRRHENKKVCQPAGQQKGPRSVRGAQRQSTSQNPRTGARARTTRRNMALRTPAHFPAFNDSPSSEGTASLPSVEEEGQLDRNTPSITVAPDAPQIHNTYSHDDLLFAGDVGKFNSILTTENMVPATQHQWGHAYLYPQSVPTPMAHMNAPNSFVATAPNHQQAVFVPPPPTAFAGGIPASTHRQPIRLVYVNAPPVQQGAYPYYYGDAMQQQQLLQHRSTGSF